MMTWSTEDCDGPWNGWLQDHKTIAVGVPNFAWFEIYMNLKNYKSVYNCNYFTQPDGKLQPPINQRSVMVFECSEG
jgi:hypothetical protein